MSRRWRTDFDESDIRVRPNPRGTRPRSKSRPRHEDAEPAWVIAVDRGRYTCLVAEGAPDERVVVAMKARELGRSGVLVGDRVALVGDVTGSPGSLARVVRVEPRTSMLRRSADDTDPVERGIVANADQLAIVTALADPTPRPRMIDRCLVAAYDAGLDPLLVLTKADLADPAEFVGNYAPLDVPYVVTRRPPGSDQPGSDQPGSDQPGSDQPGSDQPTSARAWQGLDDVRAAVAGRVTVLVGHSGVGKSTLVNALVPGADRATGSVNDVTGRGRHTTTSAVALCLPGSGWVVDTPGVRSFGLAHVNPDRIVHHFPDLARGTRECPRGCTHDEPECGLDKLVDSGEAGRAGPGRLRSLRRLLRSRTANETGPDDDLPNL